MDKYREAITKVHDVLGLIAVKGKDCIDRLLGCIIALQDDDMTIDKLRAVRYTLDTIYVAGANLEMMFSCMETLDGVINGTLPVEEVHDG